MTDTPVSRGIARAKTGKDRRWAGNGGFRAPGVGSGISGIVFGKWRVFGLGAVGSIG